MSDKWCLVVYPGTSWSDVAKVMAETGLCNPVKVKDYEDYPRHAQATRDRAELTPADTVSAVGAREFLA